MKKYIFILVILFSVNIFSQKNAGEYFLEAYYLQNLKNYKEAIFNYTKAIEILPNYYSAYIERAECKFYLKDYRGAILDYTKAIEINPNDAESYYSRGGCKFILNDKNGACLDWSKVGELGGDAYEKIQKHCN